MSDAKYCSNCGAEASANNFCENCGQPLRSRSSAELRLPSERDARFDRDPNERATAEESQKKKRGMHGCVWVLIGVAAVLALLFVIGIFTEVMSNDPVCPNANEAVFLNSLSEQFLSIGTTMTPLTALMGQPLDDPLILLDDSWILEVAINLAAIQLSAKEVLLLDAPASMQEMELLADNIAHQLTRATDLIADGIDWLDASTITEASSVLAASTNDLSDLRFSMDGFCD